MFGMSIGKVMSMNGRSATGRGVHLPAVQGMAQRAAACFAGQLSVNGTGTFLPGAFEKMFPCLVMPASSGTVGSSGRGSQPRIQAGRLFGIL